MSPTEPTPGQDHAGQSRHTPRHTPHLPPHVNVVNWVESFIHPVRFATEGRPGDGRVLKHRWALRWGHLALVSTEPMRNAR